MLFSDWLKLIPGDNWSCPVFSGSLKTERSDFWQYYFIIQSIASVRQSLWYFGCIKVTYNDYLTALFLFSLADFGVNKGKKVINKKLPKLITYIKILSIKISNVLCFIMPIIYCLMKYLLMNFQNWNLIDITSQGQNYYLILMIYWSQSFLQRAFFRYFFP